MFTETESSIIEHIEKKKICSSSQLLEAVELKISRATLKRLLSKLVSEEFITVSGAGRSTKYSLSPIYELIKPVSLDKCYEKEIDEREIKTDFNFRVITEVLDKHSLFTIEEIEKLNDLHDKYQSNISELSETEFKREMERLAIDLSWKSSQIEGNTYSLLETEKLLKEKETASGKTKEEAVMLLNHKYALDFIVEHTDYLNPLTVSKIEDIHSLLIKELAVQRNLRKRRVGISGTNYRPLDNEHQILDALRKTCDVINRKQSAFEKALLALVLISYIQPFMDGNKRTARIVSNAILIDEGYCPLSFRTVDSIDYKKAMLLFYEQNNISAFKKIFIDQFKFAVNTYF